MSGPGGDVPDVAGVVAAVEEATLDLQALWDECMVELGSALTSTQFRVLLAIDRRGPLRLGQLADELRSSPSPMSKIVDRLEHAGFVARSTDSRNGQAIKIALSSAGTKFAEWTHQRHRATLAAVIAKMDQRELVQLTSALGDLHRAMDHEDS